MKPIKQTVYVPVAGNCDLEEEIEATYSNTGSLTAMNIVKRAYSLGLSQFKPEEGYFFTPEQMNEYTAQVIRQSNENSAHEAKIKVSSHSFEETHEEIKCFYGANYAESCYTSFVKPCTESIINTFEDTFEKFKV